MGKIDNSELNKSILGKTETQNYSKNESYDVYMKADGYFIVDKEGIPFTVTILDEHKQKMYDTENKYFKFKLKEIWNFGWN